MADGRSGTDRMILRPWRVEDVPEVLGIGRDVRVMRFLGPVMTERDARHFVDGQIANQRLFGHCFWAVERRSDDRLIGICGLNVGPAETPLADALELAGWFAADTWGNSYAHEAASACIDWAWRATATQSIAAMTAPGNHRSRRLMERLGMRRSEAD
ncbi:GNAT family N-acetyltransferase, partial [Streptococcus suis]